MRLLMLTKYAQKGASSRLRSLQYQAALQSDGIEIKHQALFDDAYLQAFYANRPLARLFYAVKGYLRRVLYLLKAPEHDLVWVEKELFPWLPFAVESWFGRGLGPMMLDYDDAIFHRYDQNRRGWVRALLSDKIDRLMAASVAVMAGNGYLLERATRAGVGKTRLIPTAINCQQYQPGPATGNHILTLGWTGTKTTLKYLEDILPALNLAASKRPLKLIVVGARPRAETSFEVEYRDWSPEAEKQALAEIDVGLMPIWDSPWERGKCAFKIIAYLAMGKPVIASAVGANLDVVVPAVGKLVSTERQWTQAIVSWQQEEYQSTACRQHVLVHYSTDVVYRQIKDLLDELSVELTEGKE